MVVFGFIFVVVVAEDVVEYPAVVVDSVDAVVEEVVLNVVVVLGMLFKVRIWVVLKIVLWFLGSNSFDEFCTKDFVTNDSAVLDFAHSFADSAIGLALMDIFALLRLLVVILLDAPIDTFEAVFPMTRFANLDFGFLSIDVLAVLVFISES